MTSAKWQSFSLSVTVYLFKSISEKTYKDGIWFPHVFLLENRTKSLTICNSQECQLFILAMHCYMWWKWDLHETKKRNQCQHQENDPIHSDPSFEVSGIRKFSSVTRYRNMVGTSLQVCLFRANWLVKRSTASQCPVLLTEKVRFYSMTMQVYNLHPAPPPKSWGWVALQCHSLSPDFASTDFHLFRSLEHLISGRTFRK